MTPDESVPGTAGAAPPSGTPPCTNAFAASTLLLRRLPTEERPVPTSRETIAVLGIMMEAEIFRFPTDEEALKAGRSLVTAFGACGLAVQFEGSGGAFPGPVIALHEAPIIQRPLDEESERYGYAGVHRTLIAADLRALKRFARATGLCVRYGVSLHMRQPPFPTEDGMIDMLVGQRAPGNFREFSVRIRELFGKPAWDDGLERRIHGPVLGRGRTLSHQGTPIFQVIGATYYQMALMHADSVNVLEREALWDGSLALVAHDLLHPPTVDPVPAPTPEQARGVGEEMAGRRTEELREQLRRIDADLKERQRAFAEQLRERDDRKRQLDAFRRDAADVGERCARDIAAILAMPDVADVRLDPDDGLMITTVPIALDRDGRRYLLGAFRINLASNGCVDVWSDEPRHPQGHHHPHVDRLNLACFGNITLSIIKYAVAYRFAEAAEIVLRWLRSYHPETTLIPLEEFPSTPIGPGGSREEDLDAQPLPAASAAGPPGRPPRDAHRSGVGRKPRGSGARQDGRPAPRGVGRR